MFDYETLIRDLRGSCIPNQRFMTMKKIGRDLASQLHAPVLHYESSKSGENSFCDIFAFYAPICPVQEAQNGFTILHSKRSRRNSISQCIMSSVRADDLCRDICKINESFTGRSIMLFAKWSTILFCLFKEKCHEGVNAQKKTAKEASFISYVASTYFLQGTSKTLLILSRKQVITWMTRTKNSIIWDNSPIVKLSGGEVQNI